jgi:hypothetical protein
MSDTQHQSVNGTQVQESDSDSDIDDGFAHETLQEQEVQPFSPAYGDDDTKLNSTKEHLSKSNFNPTPAGYSQLDSLIDPTQEDSVAAHAKLSFESQNMLPKEDENINKCQEKNTPAGYSQLDNLVDPTQEDSVPDHAHASIEPQNVVPMEGKNLEDHQEKNNMFSSEISLTPIEAASKVDTAADVTGGGQDFTSDQTQNDAELQTKVLIANESPSSQPQISQDFMLCVKESQSPVLSESEPLISSSAAALPPSSPPSKQQPSQQNPAGKSQNFSLYFNHSDSSSGNNISDISVSSSNNSSPVGMPAETYLKHEEQELRKKNQAREEQDLKAGQSQDFSLYVESDNDDYSYNNEGINTRNPLLATSVSASNVPKYPNGSQVSLSGDDFSQHVPSQVVVEKEEGSVSDGSGDGIYRNDIIATSPEKTSVKPSSKNRTSSSSSLTSQSLIPNQTKVEPNISTKYISSTSSRLSNPSSSHYHPHQSEYESDGSSFGGEATQKFNSQYNEVTVIPATAEEEWKTSSNVASQKDQLDQPNSRESSKWINKGNKSQDSIGEIKIPPFIKKGESGDNRLLLALEKRRQQINVVESVDGDEGEHSNRRITTSQYDVDDGMGVTGFPTSQEKSQYNSSEAEEEMSNDFDEHEAGGGGYVLRKRDTKKKKKNVVPLKKTTIKLLQQQRGKTPEPPSDRYSTQYLCQHLSVLMWDLLGETNNGLEKLTYYDVRKKLESRLNEVNLANAKKESQLASPSGSNVSLTFSIDRIRAYIKGFMLSHQQVLNRGSRTHHIHVQSDGWMDRDHTILENEDETLENCGQHVSVAERYVNSVKIFTVFLFNILLLVISIFGLLILLRYVFLLQLFLDTY